MTLNAPNAVGQSGKKPVAGVIAGDYRPRPLGFVRTQTRLPPGPQRPPKKIKYSFLNSLVDLWTPLIYLNIVIMMLCSGFIVYTLGLICDGNACHFKIGESLTQGVLWMIFSSNVAAFHLAAGVVIVEHTIKAKINEKKVDVDFLNESFVINAIKWLTNFINRDYSTAARRARNMAIYPISYGLRRNVDLESASVGMEKYRARNMNFIRVLMSSDLAIMLGLSMWTLGAIYFDALRPARATYKYAAIGVATLYVNYFIVQDIVENGYFKLSRKK